MLPEGLHAAFIAQAAGIGNLPVASHNDKFPVALGNQRIHGASGGLAVVGADAGEIVIGKLGSVIGYQYAGNVDLMEVLLEVLLIAA